MRPKASERISHTKITQVGSLIRQEDGGLLYSLTMREAKEAVSKGSFSECALAELDLNMALA
jgi:hypothetical protein